MDGEFGGDDEKKSFGDLIDAVVTRGRRIDRRALGRLIEHVSVNFKDHAKGQAKSLPSLTTEERYTRQIAELFTDILFSRELIFGKEEREGEEGEEGGTATTRGEVSSSRDVPPGATFGALLDSIGPSFHPTSDQPTAFGIWRRVADRLSCVFMGNKPIDRGTYSVYHPVQVEAALALLKRLPPKYAKTSVAALLIARQCRPHNGPETVGALYKAIEHGIAAVERHAPSLMNDPFLLKLLTHVLAEAGEAFMFSENARAPQILLKLLGDVYPARAEIFRVALGRRISHHATENLSADSARILARLIHEMGLLRFLDPLLEIFVPHGSPLHEAIRDCSVALAGLKPAKRRRIENAKE